MKRWHARDTYGLAECAWMRDGWLLLYKPHQNGMPYLLTNPEGRSVGLNAATQWGARRLASWVMASTPTLEQEMERAIAL